MSQTHSIVAAYRNHVKARLEQRKGRNGAAASNHLKYEANKRGMVDSDAPHEVRHQLTDYRGENRVLAFRIMTRLEAHGLNERLKGTGFGWAVKTGY